jgi:hypothetical protein
MLHWLPGAQSEADAHDCLHAASPQAYAPHETGALSGQ